MQCAVFDICGREFIRGKCQIRQRLGSQGATGVPPPRWGPEIDEKLFHTWETVLPCIFLKVLELLGLQRYPS
jgi:hypothetical protein